MANAVMDAKATRSLLTRAINAVIRDKNIRAVSTVRFSITNISTMYVRSNNMIHNISISDILGVLHCKYTTLVDRARAISNRLSSIPRRIIDIIRSPVVNMSIKALI